MSKNHLNSLGSVAKVISGYAFKSADFIESGIPVVKIKNIRAGYLDLSNSDRVAKSHNQIAPKYHVRSGDILISLTGSHMNQPNSVVGRVALCRENTPHSLLNQRAGKIIIHNSEKTSVNYLFYYLSRSETSSAIALMANGAASQANVSPTQIESLLIPLPALAEQKRIAGILSAYDDLIENNLRRIKILEEMAQSLYREWFVHFRFPNHETTEFHPFPLGLIPKGWEVKKLDEVCNLTMGQSPKSEFYNNNEEGLPFHQGVTNFGQHFPTTKQYATTVTRKAVEGDILFSVRAPVGRINVASCELILGRGLSAIQHKQGFQHFLLFQLKHLFINEDSMGNGAIFKSVTKKDMQEIKLICPPNSLLEHANSILGDMFNQIYTLSKSNQNLRKTRDLLLPKLLTPSTTKAPKSELKSNY